MPSTIFYLAGGILIGILVFSTAYHLLTVSMNQALNQQAISQFYTLHSEIEYICLQAPNSERRLNIQIPPTVRVIYVTDDVETIIPVVDKIKNREMSSGSNLCLQFKTEQVIRCVELTCRVTIPYMGSLPGEMDFELLVKRILGRPVIKEYVLNLRKTTTGEVMGELV